MDDVSKTTQPSLRVRPCTGRPAGTVASRFPKPVLLLASIPILTFSVLACGGGQRPVASESESLSGMALVGGVALERRGLLVVPTDGGTAELRGVLDPSEVLWRGRLSLPPTVDARSLGPVIVLRTTNDSVFTYDPERDALHEIGELAGNPAWSGSEEGGVYYTPERILAVTIRDGRLITPDDRVVWASPAAGGRVVALVATPSSTRLIVWGENVESPEAAETVDAGLPGLVTAWGERLILARAGARELVQFGLPDLEPTESIRLDAQPYALASSPSSHRIYAGLDGETALVSVDRFTWSQRDQGRFPAPVREVRPSPTGDRLLAFDGSTAWLLTPESDEPVALDLEWRPDLPIGLPGGGVLGVRGDSMWVSKEPGGEVVPLDAPAGAWWLPVSWVPSRQRMQLAGREDGPGSGRETPAEEVDEAAAVDEPAVAQAESGIETQPVPTEAAVDASAPVVSVPPGFYAIAASSQRAGGVHDLSEALEGDGYPTQVVPRRDEANEIWYRLMVGPYDTRAEADDILLQLRRERGIQGWVREVAQEGFGAGDGDEP